MHVVSRFEHDLLEILHGFLGRAPLEQTLPLLAAACERQPKLAPEAARLVQDTLAKGCVALLARGGWRRERYLRGEFVTEGRVVEGRLWERSTPDELGLGFSANALDFLLWCTAVSLRGANARWQPRKDRPLTLGDRLLLFLAYRAVRSTQAADVLLRQRVLADHALCRLAFPQDYAADAPPPDMAPWMHSPGSCLLEALQAELADRWVEIERGKTHLQLPSAMQRIGRSQWAALDALLSAAEAAGRRDLVRFLLVAAQRIFRTPPSPRAWVRSLDVSGLRLSERADVYRDALALPHALETLHRWQREALATGYTDEGYAAAQLWKSQWERLEGDLVCRHARAMIAELA
jgi:hypothetical protein